MPFEALHPWQVTAQEAIAIQESLRVRSSVKIASEP
jgi:hypothetical protein